MSTSRLVLDGLAELRAALRQLPEALRADGVEIINDATERTAASLRQSYPVRATGNLRGGVRIKTEYSPFGAIGIVRSTAKHAHLWEFGTQSRKTRQGWNRGKARDHKKDGLVPIAVRERKRMNAKLVELVKRAGFEVTGA